MVLVYGVVEAGLTGWARPPALGPILAGLALLGAFCVIENRSLGPADPVQGADQAAQRRERDRAAVQRRAVPDVVPELAVPAAGARAVAAPRRPDVPADGADDHVRGEEAGKLVSRFGVRAVLGCGLLMMTAGMLLFTKIAASGSAVVYVILPGLLTAAGIGMSIVPSTIAATQGAKQGQAGLASGLVNTSRQVGGGLGLAVLITLATPLTSHLIGNGHAVPQALTDGFRLAYFIAAGLCGRRRGADVHARRQPAPGQGVAASRGRSLLALAVGGVIVAFVARRRSRSAARTARRSAPTRPTTPTATSRAPGLHPPIIAHDGAPTDSTSLPPATSSSPTSMT